MKLIGLDIGTTGCKASVFTEDGTLLGVFTREYAVDIPHSGWAEQDAESVWQLAQEVIQEAVVVAGIKKTAAIGLSVQGEAVMPVDQHGAALRPAILGMDTRTVEQNRWLVERFGARELFDLTGMPVLTINTLPKLMWLKQNEPQIWESAHRFLLYEDFIINKFTGRACISKNLASRTQLYDLRAGSWSPQILSMLDLDEDRLAALTPSGTPVGEMLPDLAKKLGFTKPPLIATGGHDQACGALGVGLVKAGLAEVSSGTAEVVEVALEKPVLTESLYQGNVSCYEHVVPGLYLAMTVNHSGGILLRWFRDQFGKAEMAEAAQKGIDAYELLFGGRPSGPSGLLVLPHFSGSGTPSFDPHSRGVILGLTLAHTRGDIALALMEGLTYELGLNLEMLTTGGVQIDELRAIGGGARSARWLQMKADVSAIPVVVPRVTEAAGWGAALLAGQAAGCFTSAAEESMRKIKFEQQYLPDPGRNQAFAHYYQLYKEVYPTLKNLLHRL